MLAVTPEELRRRQDDIAVSDVTSLNTLVISDDETTVERIDTLAATDTRLDPEHAATAQAGPVVAGAASRFRAVLMTAMLAVLGLMPMAVSCLLLIPVVLSRSSITIDELRSGGLLPSNLTVLAPEDAGPRLLALLVKGVVVRAQLLLLVQPQLPV